jgi:acyl-ACP thioesterase
VDLAQLEKLAGPLLAMASLFGGALWALLQREMRRSDRLDAKITNHMQHTEEAEQKILEHMVEQTTLLRSINSRVG